MKKARKCWHNIKDIKTGTFIYNQKVKIGRGISDMVYSISICHLKPNILCIT